MRVINEQDAFKDHLLHRAQVDGTYATYMMPSDIGKPEVTGKKFYLYERAAPGTH